MLGSFRTMSGLVSASAARASGTGRYMATPAPSSVSLVSSHLVADGVAGQEAAALLRGEAADVEGLALVRRRGIGGPGGERADEQAREGGRPAQSGEHGPILVTGQAAPSGILTRLRTQAAREPWRCSRRILRRVFSARACAPCG